MGKSLSVHQGKEKSTPPASQQFGRHQGHRHNVPYRPVEYLIHQTLKVRSGRTQLFLILEQN